MVLALTLVSGMAFAATGKDAKNAEKSKEAKKEEAEAHKKASKGGGSSSKISRPSIPKKG